MSNRKTTQVIELKDAGATILVAEDDDVCRSVLTDLLAAKGYHVLEATNGQQAVQILSQQANKVSLIISDINMPFFSGTDLLAHVYRQNVRIPIILITARASIDSAVDCMKKGALGYLAKPLDTDKLFKLVEEGFRRRKRHDSRWQSIFADQDGPPGYIVERLIGEGNYGLVFLVHKGQQPYALKVVKSLGIKENERQIAASRFIHESKALATLRHPNIIAFQECGLTGNSQIPYLVMEYFPCDEWETLLAQPLQTRLELLLQAARGLEAIHQAGFCHRDIKPNNLLFNCEKKLLKWSDFGLIHLPNSAITMTGQNLGTPAYMSPEAFDSHRTDTRADIFSLGVVAYEICTGADAFKGESVQQLAAAITYRHPVEPRTLNPDIPETLQKSIGKMLSKNPDDRQQTVGQVIAEWQECLELHDWKVQAAPASFMARIMQLFKRFKRRPPSKWNRPTSAFCIDSGSQF